MADALLTDHRAKLKQIASFPSLIRYLREEMGWPIEGDDLEPITFEYTAEELGIEPANAAKILEIKRLRPLAVGQPWGIFFVGFEPKRLPVVALRRILSRVVLKKRASANSADRAAWQAEDLLFVSNFGEGDERQICFAHFTVDGQKTDLPTLKVLGWNDLDTPLRLDHVADTLTERLAWPDDERDSKAWREQWRSAFTLRHREVITTSKLLAERLAELARAIRNRINTVLSVETEDGPLTKLMEAFREALVHDLDADGFADMYAQTIAYGLLSARIADPEAATADDFAAHMRTNPFLKELMETFLHVGGRRKSGNGVGLDFDELGVSEVVALLDAAKMEAVLRDFGDRKPEDDPVIHFYELFLKEYDAKKRTQRGVFYTPLPVVSYIVRSVHELLQTDFGLPDGLADTATWDDMAKRHPRLTLPEGVKPTDRFVTVLDPATGTGTFLVEAIEVIHRTLVDRWKREGHSAKYILDLWNEYVPKHLLPRLHGYELMMAPYAIAHVKIGLKLHETGYRFEGEERARIYLTNALEPAHDFSGTLAFAIPALAHEATAVNAVKRHQRFTIAIGNPPYSGHSLNNDVAWIVDKVYDYKRGFADLQKAGQAKWLQDDYVKFIRLTHHLIVSAGVGVVGLITNNGLVDNPTFKGLRSTVLTTFSSVTVLNLHGSVMKRERTTDGYSDSNVFDIQQSVAISLIELRPIGHAPIVRYSTLVGSREHKYEWLGNHTALSSDCVSFEPRPPFYLFTPSDAELNEEFQHFVGIPELFNQNGDPAPGVVTTHDDFAISWTQGEQIRKVEALVATRSEDEARGLFRLCSQAQWNYARAKQMLNRSDWRSQLVRVLYRPFDRRWTVYDPNVAVHRRTRVSDHMRGIDNLALLFMRQVALDDEYTHFGVSDCIVDNRAFYSNRGIMYMAPLYVLSDPQKGGLFGPQRSRNTCRENLNPKIVRQLCDYLGVCFAPIGREVEAGSVGPEDIFCYAYAVFHSPTYRHRYDQILKIDFPRLPTTPSLELFSSLSRLGRKLVTLHLVKAPMQRAVSARYEKSAQRWLCEVANGQPLSITLTFNGTGKPVVGTVLWSHDTVWIDAAKPRKTATDAKVTGTVGFRGVPEEVWDFHIGGYRVCEKWLKDRRGRTLTADDITHYYRIVIALHETVRIMREIDEVIEAHGGWPGAFQPPSSANSKVAEAAPEQQELVSAQPARERTER